MHTNSIFILGGYGNTGRLIASLLLQETDCRLVVAGRSLVKAEAVAATLNAHAGSPRVTAMAADAADVSSLRRAMAGCELAVIASSTADHVAEVARAALDTKTDYLDVQFATAKVHTLQRLASEIEAAGCCFITDGGFHPGLPAALVRHAAAQFDHLQTAVVASVIKGNWRRVEIGRSTAEEMVRELAGYQALEYRDGAWRQARWTSLWLPQTMDFGPPFGRQYAVPMFLEEMRALPALFPDLQAVSFNVGGFNWFVDMLVLPLAMAAMRIAPTQALSPMARWLLWGLQRFSRPPYGTVLRLEARGEVQGQPKRFNLTLSHADGYWFTAIPVAACLLQVLDGSARQPGLWFQASIVEPQRLLHDMQRMGITIR